MEEDNRSYHRSHPFRQYQYRRISETNANATVTSTVAASTSTIPSVDDAASLSLFRFQQDEPSPMIRLQGGCCERSGGIGIHHSNRAVVPSEEFRIINGTNTPKTKTKTITTIEDTTHKTSTIGDQKRCTILGMTPMEDDDDDDDDDNNCNEETIPIRQDVPIQQESPYTLVEETKRLFQDYHHRFHRQSLTQQAKELLDRATVMAKGCGSGSNNNDNSASIALCTEALELCRHAIQDQEEAYLNRTGNVIGGSYLVTGDIRLRRKGESLEAKICCLRAAVRYKEGWYHESLADCEAAIAIWEQQCQRETTNRIVARRTTVPAAAAAAAFPKMGHPFESPLSLQSQSRTSTSTALTSTAITSTALTSTAITSTALTSTAITSTAITRTSTSTIQSTRTSPPRRARKLLSHKHLYLLKGRVLAAMGRYREAVVWLTHPQKLPARIFRRSSALLETDVAMNKFLDQLTICSRSRKNETNIPNTKLEDVAKTNSGSTPARAAWKVPPTASTSTTASTINTTGSAMAMAMAMIPANTKVWSNLLHSVDKRLNEVMAGKFHATHTSSSCSSSCNSNSNSTRSNSASAIYQMLCHGPVLFHHYHYQDQIVDDNDDKKAEALATTTNANTSS